MQNNFKCRVLITSLLRNFFGCQNQQSNIFCSAFSIANLEEKMMDHLFKDSHNYRKICISEQAYLMRNRMQAYLHVNHDKQYSMGNKSAAK